MQKGVLAKHGLYSKNGIRPKNWSYTRASGRRGRRRREEKRRRRRRGEEKKKKKRKARYENLYGTYQDLYEYLFGGLEYLFLCRILIWNKSLRYGYLIELSFGLVVVLN